VKNRRDAMFRIARRAHAGAHLLPVPERIQLFEDLSLILPEREAQVCKDAAAYLRESENLQLSLASILQ